MYSYENIQMISCPREGLTERIVKKVRTSRVININTHWEWSGIRGREAEVLKFRRHASQVHSAMKWTWFGSSVILRYLTTSAGQVHRPAPQTLGSTPEVMPQHDVVPSPTFKLMKIWIPTELLEMQGKLCRARIPLEFQYLLVLHTTIVGHRTSCRNWYSVLLVN